MSIDLANSKKKHPNYVCLSVSAASKYVSGEYTCKSGLKANYFYKSGKVFNNPRWNLEHGLALQESIKFLTKSLKNQLKPCQILRKSIGIQFNPFDILRKSFGNTLNSLTNPIESLQNPSEID